MTEEPTRLERDVDTIKTILVVAAVVIAGVLGWNALEANERRTDHVIHCAQYPYASDCP